MKRIKIIGACMAAVAVAGAVLAAASYADVPDSEGFGPLAATPFSDAVLTPSGGFPVKEMAVLTDQGISPARASQALSLQRRVGETHLASKIEAALADDYAGAWFEPAAALFHIGVTSNASREVAKRVVAAAGLTAGVVETPVRSTWAALLAAQSQWDKRLAKLLESQEATTGLDSQHNAVSITLSSSIPARERMVLEHEAAIASVNVIVNIVAPSRLRIKPIATCKFETSKAYCEKTIVSGVSVVTEKGTKCTAGPMLIEGNETYLLTAGHCFGERNGAGGTPIAEKVTSEYPTGGGQKEIGKEGKWFENEERDIAEIKVVAGSFTEALPTPVPALMAEWGKKTETPQDVTGVEVNVEGQDNCHEGQTSGEQCGMVEKLNASAAGTKHLVEDSACGEKGDSGGPFFVHEGSTNNVLMQGVAVAANIVKKCSEGEKGIWYEPLKDVAGGATYGILSTFAGQELLTTATENRTKDKEEKERKEKEEREEKEGKERGGGSGRWEECSEGISATKYTEDQCLKAEGSGKWQWKEVTSTEKIVGHETLAIADTKAPIIGKVVVKCVAKDEGSVGPGHFDRVTTITEVSCSAGENCEKLEGNAEAVNLPWQTETYETEGKLRDRITNGNKGSGAPGWKFKCKVLSVVAEDVCTNNEETTSLENKVSKGTELLVVATFESKSGKGECKEGGAKSGEVTGTVAILKTNGWGLRVA